MPTFWHRNRKTDEAVLAPRTGSPVKRDVYKAAAAGVTGLTAFGALSVTGAVAGMAAHDKAVQDAQKVVPPTPPAPRSWRSAAGTGPWSTPRWCTRPAPRPSSGPPPAAS